MIDAPHLLPPFLYSSTRWISLVDFEETGDPKEGIYLDSAGIPTIGVGFNLQTTFVRLAVLESFGFDLTNDPNEAQYIQAIATAAAQTYSSKADAQNAFDEIMEDRANDPNVIGTLPTKPSTFVFPDESAIRAVFDTIIVSYETEVDSWLASIPGQSTLPGSLERIALLSLQYNGVLDESISLRVAFEDGNRAEAWYEIRYNTNGGNELGIAKRRAAESEFFGLYDAQADSPGSMGQEQALSIFRMFTRHEQNILAKEQAFPNAVPYANRDYTYAVRTREESFAPAQEHLIATFLSFDEGQVDLNQELGSTLWGAGDGSLRAVLELALQGVTNSGQSSSSQLALLNTLLGYQDNLDGIFVAAETSAGTGEVVAQTVDRGAAGTENDLIFGTSQADSLNGASGDDVFVGSEGADTIVGGGGIDTAIYAESSTGVSVDLQSGTGSGGLADGDSFSGVEAVIGSAFSDTIQGTASSEALIGQDGHDDLLGSGGDDVILGGAGADSIEGGPGDDILIGGDGSDVIKAADSDYVDPGAGNDVIDLWEDVPSNAKLLFGVGYGHDAVSLLIGNVIQITYGTTITIESTTTDGSQLYEGYPIVFKTQGGDTLYLSGGFNFSAGSDTHDVVVVEFLDDNGAVADLWTFGYIYNMVDSMSAPTYSDDFPESYTSAGYDFLAERGESPLNLTVASDNPLDDAGEQFDDDGPALIGVQPDKPLEDDGFFA